ncbi:MAG: DUF3794 domain-containing protein [Eubacteriales bacterium]
MNNSKFLYRARVYDRAEPCELSDDYTLPDYMPAVGRVISCTASVAPPSLYLAGGSIEYAGGVRYRLLYESADDGSLWCAELPSEYDIFISPDRDTTLPSDPDLLSGLADVRAENVTARITAPRRLTVKSRVKLAGDLTAQKPFETTLRGDTSDAGAVKTLTVRTQSGTAASVNGTPVTCRDKITPSEIGLSENDDIRIITTRGDVMLKTLESVGDQIECRGEVCVSLLFIKEGEGERPRRITRKLPFSSALQLDAQNVGTRAYGACPNLNARVEEGGIALEGDVIVCAESLGTTELSYIKDVYSQTADCETSRTKLTLSRPLACFNANATVSASAPLSALALDSGMKLCDYSARITDWSADIDERGRLTVSGKMKVSALADNGAELIPAEFDSDFKYTADIPDASAAENPTVSIIPTLCDLKCRIDGDRMSADCELCLAIKIENASAVSILSEVNFTPSSAPAPSSSRIIICYPAAGESLWDVAKRYRSDADLIADKNDLKDASPEAPVGAKYLII